MGLSTLFAVIVLVIGFVMILRQVIARSLDTLYMVCAAVLVGLGLFALLGG